MFKGGCSLTKTVHLFIYLSCTNFDTESTKSKKKNPTLDSDKLTLKIVSTPPDFTVSFVS